MWNRNSAHVFLALLPPPFSAILAVDLFAATRMRTQTCTYSTDATRTVKPGAARLATLSKLGIRGMSGRFQAALPVN